MPQYVVKKLLRIISISSIESYSVCKLVGDLLLLTPISVFALLRSNFKLIWVMKLRRDQLLSVVRHSTVDFIQQYLSFPVPPSHVISFTKENITRAFEIANEREDGNEMLLYLFPILVKLCFDVSDPQHVQVIAFILNR